MNYMINKDTFIRKFIRKIFIKEFIGKFIKEFIRFIWEFIRNSMDLLRIFQFLVNKMKNSFNFISFS